jgi:hypothetical protein
MPRIVIVTCIVIYHHRKPIDRTYTVACICSHVLRIRYLHLYRYRNQTVTFFHEHKLTTKHYSDIPGSECYQSRESADLYKLVYGYHFQIEVTIMRKLIFSN